MSILFVPHNKVDTVIIASTCMIYSQSRSSSWKYHQSSTGAANMTSYKMSYTTVGPWLSPVNYSLSRSTWIYNQSGSRRIDFSKVCYSRSDTKKRRLYRIKQSLCRCNK